MIPGRVPLAGELAGRADAFVMICTRLDICEALAQAQAVVILERAALHVAMVRVPCWTRYSQSAVPFDGVQL